MDDKLKEAVAARYRAEIGRVRTPPFPGTDALAARAARTEFRNPSPRRLPRADMLVLAGAACLFALCFSLSAVRPALAPSRGAELLFRDPSVRGSASSFLSAAALRLGDSIRKE